MSQGIYHRGFYQNTTQILGSIVAGDGYFYLAYACREFSPAVAHLMLLRVSSSGDSAIIHMGDWPDAGGDFIDVTASMITNADTGVALSWQSPGQTSLTITTGTGFSTTSGPKIAGQSDGAIIEPVLQAEDGSFIGKIYIGESATWYMVAFDQTGNVRWSVPNEQPQIATADGGVIGQSGITYDQNGNATGQSDLATQSWTSYAYRMGSIEQILANPIYYALSFWAFQAGNESRNMTASSRRDSKSNSKVMNLLTPSFWKKFAGSHCGTVLANGMSALISSPYSLEQVQNKQSRTNFYDIGNPGVGNLTLKEVTNGDDSRTTLLSDFVAVANAATTPLKFDKQTAVVMRASVLSDARPEFTLVHEIVFHAYGQETDDNIFNYDFFKMNGLWRDSSASTNITTWLSTDCTCTPGKPGTSCPANSATW